MPPDPRNADALGQTSETAAFAHGLDAKGLQSGIVGRLVSTRLGKFLAVGTVAFFIDVGVFQAVLLFEASPYVARFVSFLIACSASWRLNRTFAFHDAGNVRADLQWAQFLATSIVGGGVNYATFVVVIATLPLAGSYPVIALAAGSVCALVFNFTAYDRYIFRKVTRRL
jgi:putative flippase GtrA